MSKEEEPPKNEEPQYVRRVSGVHTRKYTPCTFPDILNPLVMTVSSDRVPRLLPDAEFSEETVQDLLPWNHSQELLQLSLRRPKVCGRNFRWKS